MASRDCFSWELVKELPRLVLLADSMPETLKGSYYSRGVFFRLTILGSSGAFWSSSLSLKDLLRVC
jgi:hypothetical protein